MIGARTTGIICHKRQIDFNYPLAGHGINRHNREIVLALNGLMGGWGVVGWRRRELHFGNASRCTTADKQSVSGNRSRRKRNEAPKEVIDGIRVLPAIPGANLNFY